MTDNFFYSEIEPLLEVGGYFLLNGVLIFLLN